MRDDNKTPIRIGGWFRDPCFSQVHRRHFAGDRNPGPAPHDVGLFMYSLVILLCHNLHFAS